MSKHFTSIKVSFKAQFTLLFLQILLHLNTVYSYGQCDTNLIKDCFSKYYNIQSGVYSIEYRSKFLTSADTLTLRGKVFFSNTKGASCDNPSKIKFILETSDHVNFVNSADSFYYYNSKVNCFEKHPSCSFDFESLNGTSLWFIFNRILITNFSCLSENTIQNCYYSEIEDDGHKQFLQIIYKASEDITERTKKIYSIGSEEELYFSETNTLSYLDMFQFDSSRIHFKSLPPESIDDSISFIIANFCSINPMATIEVNQSDSVFNLTSFELFSTDGTQFDLSKVNSRYILLDFWHKGCIPCLKAIPHINALKMTFSDEEVSIFGINPIDNLNNIKETIKQKNISYCVLADKNRSLSKLLSINAYPTILIIDTKRNKIVYAKSGFNEDIDIEITLILKNLLKNY